MTATFHGFTSPLRYPGGKGMLANFIKLVLVHNDLLDGHYVEPYAGGASIAWSLLFEEYVRHVHINDLSIPVMAFWRAVLAQPDELCRLIHDTPVTIDEWHRQQAIQLEPNAVSAPQLAFSTFFLNRTNWSGILKGGVLGGHAQSGKWKLDARYNKPDLTARIQRIARYAQRISLYNINATQFIRLVIPKLPRKTLVYLDPPYYTKGEGLYDDHYTDRDHRAIARLVRTGLRRPWIVSYDAHPNIEALYAGEQYIKYTLSYSANDRYAGSEVMFISDRLQFPRIPNPTAVERSMLIPHRLAHAAAAAI